MTPIKTTYGQLSDGDIVFVQGHQFQVSGLRSMPVTWKGPTEETVIRFEGHCVDLADDIRGTSYDGGTYGAIPSATIFRHPRYTGER